MATQQMTETMEQAVARVVAERTAAERERAEKLAQVRLRGEVEAGMKRLERQEAEAARAKAFQDAIIEKVRAKARENWVGDDASFDTWWHNGGAVQTIASASAEIAKEAEQRARVQYTEF